MKKLAEALPRITCAPLVPWFTFCAGLHHGLLRDSLAFVFANVWRYTPGGLTILTINI